MRFDRGEIKTRNLKTLLEKWAYHQWPVRRKAFSLNFLMPIRVDENIWSFKMFREFQLRVFSLAYNLKLEQK